jgi:predicted dehydrogenase
MNVRWGLVGAGDIARKRVAPALRDVPRSRLLGVARAHAERAEAFAREFGAERWYRDDRELLADPDVDAVYLATPVHRHAGQAIAAAEAGKHVLCEKPMALDVEECGRMIEAARANGVKLGIAYYRRFYPVVGRIKALLADGEIGTPVLCQVNAFEWLDMRPDHPRGWFLRKGESGGGPMFDFGCHRIEVLLNLFGGVRAVKGLVANAFFDREVEDTAAAVLGFEHGTCAMLAVTHATSEARDTLDLFGTRGMVHVPNLNRGELMITSGGSTRREDHPPAANLHAPLVQDFVDAVLSDREPAVGGETGRAVAAVEEQIYEGATPASRSASA